MSHKQGQESHTSYMDGVKVKISEQYKPPPRINLAISYSQRLTLNKQIQDNITKYDYTLEASVRSKMKEWRVARNMMAEERRIRFEKSREERKIREEERQQKEQEIKNKLSEQEVKSIDNISNAHENSFTHLGPGIESPQNYITYTSSSGMLIPTQVLTTPYSNILTPTTLPHSTNNQSQSHTTNSTDKSSFNISEFEADTSSPFDNMELKSINEMEELALVLKNDDSTIKNQNSYSYGTSQSQYYSNYQNPMTTYIYGNQRLPPESKTRFIQPSPYSGTNGYYCPSSSLFKNQSYTVPYACNKPIDVSNSFDRLSPQSIPINDNKNSFKPVPDIIKSLETELNNTHIDKMMGNPIAPVPVVNKNFSASKVSQNNKVAGPTSHKSNSQKTVSQFSNSNNVDDLEDPFNSLSLDMQKLSKTISAMGFPLPRVARACKLIGTDHKKIVEHLLAMSELLDLGFSERDVSSALLQCNNDRDKALDVLC